MESVGGYAYFVSEGTLSADLKFLFFFFLKTFFYTFFEPENVGQRIFLVGKLSFKRIA